MSHLGIWLYDELVGHLSSPRTDRLRFEPSEGSLSKWGEGSTMLSVALPLSSEVRLPSDRLRAFFNGLLPEGAARNELNRRFNLRPRDILGLLGELGEDCAGAVVALRSGQVPRSRTGGYQEIADRDVSELILKSRISSAWQRARSRNEKVTGRSTTETPPCQDAQRALGTTDERGSVHPYFETGGTRLPRWCVERGVVYAPRSGQRAHDGGRRRFRDR